MAVPALLHSPAPAGAPRVSGGSTTGSTLTCSPGQWAPDLPGAFLHRAPQSLAYQWLLNGSPVAGATQASLTPTTAGSYSCRVTATNQAGSALQISAATQVSAAPAPVTAVPPPARSRGTAFAARGVKHRRVVLKHVKRRRATHR